MELTRRGLLATLALGIASASTLSACGREKAEAGAGAGLAPVSIGVGIDATYAAFFVADAKGYFKEHGLDVKLVQFGAGGESVQAIAGRQVQFAGSSTMTAISMAAQNTSLRALATYLFSEKYVKVVANAAVSGPKDIKKFGVVPGMSRFMAGKYLEANGVSPDSVEFVTSSPAELPALTKQGEVDAYVLWEPWAANGKQMGLKILTDTGAFGQPISQVLLTDESYLKDNSDTAAAVLEALAEAATFITDDPQASAEIVSQATKIEVQQARDAIDLVEFGNRGFTEEDYRSYDEQAAFYVDTGALSAAPDLKTLFVPDWYAANVEGQ